MNKYSFRIFGTFSAEDYAKAQLAILTAVQSLDGRLRRSFWKDM